MVAAQLISKVLLTSDYSIIENNLLDAEYFVGYEEEFNFITNHRNQYGNVPDKETFISKFPDFELVEVNESDRYLVSTIQEEHLYYKAVPVVQQIATLLKTDANAAAEYMIQSLKDLQPRYEITGIDIVANARDRLKDFQQKKDKKSNWFFTTGFEELDYLIHGFNRDISELVVLFARTNMGKSWIAEKMTTHIWQIGNNVGYISPELNAQSVGYRFDTLNKNFSNKGLMWGNEEIDESQYSNYIDTLTTSPHRFVVATSIDFDNRITVSKLRNWIKQYDIQFMVIDGISYLTDERYKRGDNKTTSLTNISEDLRLLSLELHLPIIVVVQSNRAGVKGDEDEGTPELENIRDSDGIAMNATKVLSIRQNKEHVLEICIKKNTFGSVGGKLKYQWNIDKGEFVFIPSYDDSVPKEKTDEKVRNIKKKYNDKEDVF